MSKRYIVGFTLLTLSSLFSCIGKFWGKMFFVIAAILALIALGLFVVEIYCEHKKKNKEF